WRRIIPVGLSLFHPVSLSVKTVYRHHTIALWHLKTSEALLDPRIAMCCLVWPDNHVYLSHLTVDSGPATRAVQYGAEGKVVQDHTTPHAPTVRRFDDAIRNSSIRTTNKILDIRRGYNVAWSSARHLTGDTLRRFESRVHRVLQKILFETLQVGSLSHKT